MRNLIKLYHYSDKDIKGKISPTFFGENSYTANSSRISGIRRAYFYTDTDKSNIEWRFKDAKYIYISAIEKNKLYDLDSNKLRDYSDIYGCVKSKGYKGIISGNIVALFEDAKIITKKENK